MDEKYDITGHRSRNSINFLGISCEYNACFPIALIAAGPYDHCPIVRPLVDPVIDSPNELIDIMKVELERRTKRRTDKRMNFSLQSACMAHRKKRRFDL